MTGPAFDIATTGNQHRTIGGDAPCFVIGEIGTNWHAGDPNDDSQALKLIDIATEAGCDAVKFQTYRPESVYVPNPGESDYLADAGIKRTINELIAERVMPEAMLSKVAAHAADQGTVFMSSCFSDDDLALVDPLTPIHKLASYEISHFRLIDALAATGKPLILSTGAADEKDIAWAVDRFRASDGAGLAVLQCTARYPAPDAAMNLRVIPWLEERFCVVAGLSDHSPEAMPAPLAAVALGAKVIEKHITLDRSAAGPDHFNSIEPDELKAMVNGIRSVEAMRGDGYKRVENAEEELFLFARRRIQAIKPVARGEALREGENMAILRPGKRSSGAHPRLIETFEGRPAKADIALGEGITENLVG